MDHTMQFYIDGRWVAPLTTDTIDVINPATEQPITSIAMGGADDVDAAVAAAKAAFETFSLTSREERLALLDSIIAVYSGRLEELADIISQEIGRTVSRWRGRRKPSPDWAIGDRSRRPGRLRVRAADGHHPPRA